MCVDCHITMLSYETYSHASEYRQVKIPSALWNSQKPKLFHSSLAGSLTLFQESTVPHFSRTDCINSLSTLGAIFPTKTLLWRDRCAWLDGVRRKEWSAAFVPMFVYQARKWIGSPDHRRLEGLVIDLIIELWVVNNDSFGYSRMAGGGIIGGGTRGTKWGGWGTRDGGGIAGGEPKVR